MQSETPSSKPNFVRLVLTPDQQAHVRASIGAEVEAIEVGVRELGVSELEERIAPLYIRCCTGTHFPDATITN